MSHHKNSECGYKEIDATELISAESLQILNDFRKEVVEEMRITNERLSDIIDILFQIQKN
jgi:hypothetical protein